MFNITFLHKMVDNDVTFSVRINTGDEKMEYTYREFSKISHVTLRTLRYYESLDLIKPIIKSDQKYLCDEHLMIMQSIELLKKCGYTLQDIKQILIHKNIEEQLIIQEDLLNIQLTNTKVMLSFIEELKEHRVEHKNLYEKFNRIQNMKNLSLQFETPDGLQTRILFHHKHTTFPQNFHQWMFDHYQFPPHAKVLEIGCGDGILWLLNQDKIPLDADIILSDISINMVKTCSQNLSHISQIKAYEEANCFDLPYEDESFDIVIANHLLMYIDDVELALQEIKRVLKHDGKLYCTSIGQDMMKERDQMLHQFDSTISFNQELLYQRFGFEIAQIMLHKYFHCVELFERQEVYQIQDVQSYYEFILSSKGLGKHLEILYQKQSQLYDFMQTYIKRHQVFPLTVHTGLFVAKKEALQ